jgi:hypothetical protein
MPRRSRQWKSLGNHPLEADAKKTIPIDHATAEAIAQQQQLFREKFGREPGPEDPLFFDPDSAVPEFLSAESQEKTWRALVQAAGESGMDPVLVYARYCSPPQEDVRLHLHGALSLGRTLSLIRGSVGLRRYCA